MADYSGTITSGGSAQTAAAADVNRIGLRINNPSDTEFWYRFGGTAAADSPSQRVQPDETHTYSAEDRSLICQTISVYGATTGKKFTILDSKA